MTNEPDDSGRDDLTAVFDESAWSSLAFDHNGTLRDLSQTRRAYWGPPPPAPPPVHVLDLPSVMGMRLILMRKEGPVRELRAASDVWTDEAGSWVKIAEEWRWFTWLNTPAYRERTPECPRTVAHSTLNVWAER